MLFHTDTPTSIRDTLFLAGPDKPEWAGSQWQGVHHHEVIAAAVGEATFKGLKMLGEPLIHLSPDRLNMAFSLTFEDESVYKPSFGFIHGSGQHFGMRAFIGLSQDGFGVPLLSCPIAVQRRGSFDLIETISPMLSVLKSSRNVMLRYLEKASQTKQSNAQVADLLVSAAEDGIIGWSKLKHILLNYRERKGVSAWDLLLAFTTIARRGSVFPYGARSGETAGLGQMETIVQFKDRLTGKQR